MAFRPKPMPEMLDRIVANYRQTGDVLNAAIRSGIDRSTFYRWKTRGEQAKSGPLREFSDSLTRARGGHRLRRHAPQASRAWRHLQAAGSRQERAAAEGQEDRRAALRGSRDAAEPSGARA